MRAIWKFGLPAGSDVTRFTINVAGGHVKEGPDAPRLLHIGEQNGRLWAWIEATMGLPLFPLRFAWVLTGEPILTDGVYLATCFPPEARGIVLHLYGHIARAT